MITVGLETFDVVEENFNLIEEHWEEVAAHDPSKRALNVDWETFRKLDDLEKLVTIVARHDGEVVGYAVFIMQQHLHAKDTLCAQNDALFLKKEYRKGTAGIKLIKVATSVKPANIIFVWTHADSFSESAGKFYTHYLGTMVTEILSGNRPHSPPPQIRYLDPF